MTLASQLLETPTSAAAHEPRERASARIVHASSLHHVGTFEGWGLFLRLLLWATRANRRV